MWKRSAQNTHNGLAPVNGAKPHWRCGKSPKRGPVPSSTCSFRCPDPPRRTAPHARATRPGPHPAREGQQAPAVGARSFVFKDCAGHHGVSADGKRVCFGFNLGTCKTNRPRGERGEHCCSRRNCYGPHPQTSCPQAHSGLRYGGGARAAPAGAGPPQPSQLHAGLVGMASSIPLRTRLIHLPAPLRCRCRAAHRP